MFTRSRDEDVDILGEAIILPNTLALQTQACHLPLYAQFPRMFKRTPMVPHIWSLPSSGHRVDEKRWWENREPEMEKAGTFLPAFWPWCPGQQLHVHWGTSALPSGRQLPEWQSPGLKPPFVPRRGDRDFLLLLIARLPPVLWRPIVTGMKSLTANAQSGFWGSGRALAEAASERRQDFGPGTPGLSAGSYLRGLLAGHVLGAPAVFAELGWQSCLPPFHLSMDGYAVVRRTGFGINSFLICYFTNVWDENPCLHKWERI